MSERIGFHWVDVTRIGKDGTRVVAARVKSACKLCFTRRHVYERDCKYPDFYVRDLSLPIPD